MSSDAVHRSSIGGMDWWDKQREQFEDSEILFGADGVMPSAYRLLAEGQPVSLDRIAAASSRPVQEVDAALRKQPGTDWDEQGRLVGFGVTLRPTPHQLTFDNGPTVFTWCASDALVAPVIVGRPATLESPCAATGRQITIRITPDRVESVDPPTAVVSLVRPDRVEDIRGEVCALGNFAVSEQAAAEWLAAHPEGMVHSVNEDYQLHRQVAEKFGWIPSRDGGAT